MKRQYLLHEACFESSPVLLVEHGYLACRRSVVRSRQFILNFENKQLEQYHYKLAVDIFDSLQAVVVFAFAKRM